MPRFSPALDRGRAPRYTAEACDFDTSDTEIGTARNDVPRAVGEADDAVERVFQEIKRRTCRFGNCVRNAEPKTAGTWHQCYASLWNCLI